MADLLSFLNEKEEDPLQLFSLMFLSLASLVFLPCTFSVAVRSPALFLARGLCLAQKRSNVNA